MPNDFLTTYTPLANDIATQTGLDPSVVLGIIDTETGGGAHVKGNNIFGISPSGPQGQYVAGYPDVQMAAQAFVTLMQTPRYRGVAAAPDPASQAVALVRGGYNTANPQYAQIVAGKALNFGKQLGYQGDQGGGGGGQTGPALYSTTAQPVNVPNYDNTPTQPQPAPAAPAPSPPASGSAKDRVLSDPALSGGDASTGSAQPGGAPQTAKDRLLADPALQVPPEKTDQAGGVAGARAMARNFDAATSGEQTAPAWMSQGPPGGPITSLQDFRNRLQQGDINALANINQQRPAPPGADSSGWDRLSYTAKEQLLEAAGIAIHGGAKLIDMPLAIAQGISEGTGGVQIDPSTNALSLTPEAQAAGSLGATPLRFSGPNGLQYVSPGTFDRGPTLSPEFKAAPMTPEASAAAVAPPGGPTSPTGVPTVTVTARAPGTAAAPPAGAGPQPGMGAPQPAGAQATPAAAATMTPEEIATQRTVADKQWLNQTVQPGVKDTTEYIPGITPNLVEQEQTVTAARELKDLKNLSPELSQQEREILDRNTEKRKGFYADTVGSDVTRAADLKAANDKIETDLKQVWSGKGEADPANVQAAIKTELAGSAGDLPPLKSAMKQVSDSLENAGTDPQAMYRTHRLINYLQSKQGQMENPGYGAADVQAALTRVKGTLAQTIDDGAPGFKQAMSDYSTARGPIDAAKALQDRENGLYDSKGHMSFLKVHALLRDIIDAQKWDAPNDPLAGVSDAQMARLKALHDDLKRTASAKDLATAAGSDTAMNLIGIAKQYGKLAGRAGIEGAANVALGPGIGSMVVRGAENLLRPFTSARSARQQMRRGMEILQPPPSNRLNPP